MVGFKLVGGAGEVGVNRLCVDKCGLESDEECKVVLCGFNVKLVESAESEIRIEGRGVAIVCYTVNCHTQVDGQLKIQVFHHPGLSAWLPGCFRDADHFLAAPSNTQGGSKSPSWIQEIRCNTVRW